jgi:hypothetical protein
MLDPRYKERFFETNMVDVYRDWLVKEATNLACQTSPLPSTAAEDSDADSMSSTSSHGNLLNDFLRQKQNPAVLSPLLPLQSLTAAHKAETVAISYCCVFLVFIQVI